jgi:hypothetical protein
MRQDEARLRAYLQAADRWREEWPAVERETEGLGLRDAHTVLVERALQYLPFTPAGGPP